MFTPRVTDRLRAFMRSGLIHSSGSALMYLSSSTSSPSSLTRTLKRASGISSSLSRILGMMVFSASR
jgi:hypothetical protein